MIEAWKPPIKLTRLSWANTRRKLAVGTTPFPGQFKAERLPWLPFILEAIDDPNVHVVVMQKHSGAGWTEGVVLNEIGRTIDIDPSGIIGLCPKEDTCTKFMKTKFEPMVKATPSLRTEVDLTAKKSGNSQTFKHFRNGGYLMLVASNSPINIKQTHVKRGFIEELDNCANDVRGEGDSVELLKKRLKSFPDSLLLIGSTPTIKGLSKIEDEYNASDKREFRVPCHHCGESHVLSWDNVKWSVDDSKDYHDIYRYERPDTAVYVCPHCEGHWTNAQKNQNVKKMSCVATAEFYGVAGFYINDIYSPLENSTLEQLVKIYLSARHDMERGDNTSMIVFYNAHLGLTWEVISDAPAADVLITRETEHSRLIAPHGVLILTAGIDLQETGRLAITIIGTGRGEETWVLFFDELYGDVTDLKDPVWKELENFIFAPIRHENGKQMYIKAISFDSGNTTENVYDFVRKFQNRGAMAVKGSSDDYGTREIFSKPAASIDTKGKHNTKASKWGLRIYMVGTYKVKDLIYSRLKLEGFGAGRIHFHKGMRQDYYEQILSEVKVPHRFIRGKEEYKKKAGINNEALDTLGYAIHALRSTRFHLYTESQYSRLESELMQGNLFDAIEQNPTTSTAIVDKKEPLPKPPPPKPATNWLDTPSDWI